VAGGSVSELVIFIAAVSVAAGVSGVMVTTVGGISDSLDERGASVSAAIETDVEVISDPGSGAVYDDATDEVTLLVKNTGDRTLPTDGSGVEVLIDGQYVPPADYEVTVVGGDEWRDGAVVRITVDRALAAGDHRATVVVRSDRETVGFRA
jgi:flagellar protein FlaG